MYVALIKDAQDDIDDDDGGQEQEGLALERRTKLGGTPGKSGYHRLGQTNLPLGLLDALDGLPEGGARVQVEGKRYRRKLALMGDGQGSGFGFQTREGAERHGAARGGFDIDFAQGVGRELKLRLGFEDDTILG